MTDLPTLPKAAYSLDLNDGFPTVAYSVQQMYDFARAALAREQEAQPAAQEPGETWICACNMTWMADITYCRGCGREKE